MYIVRWLFEARVYALTDFDGNVFYVGCTTRSLKERLFGHLGHAKAYDNWTINEKCEKIRTLDFKVKIIELERLGVFGIDNREAARFGAVYEKKWIDKFISEGIALTNCEHTEKKARKKYRNENRSIKY
jgi:hypothetical protein